MYTCGAEEILGVLSPIEYHSFEKKLARILLQTMSSFPQHGNPAGVTQTSCHCSEGEDTLRPGGMFFESKWLPNLHPLKVIFFYLGEKMEVLHFSNFQGGDFHPIGSCDEFNIFLVEV